MLQTQSSAQPKLTPICYLASACEYIEAVLQTSLQPFTTTSPCRDHTFTANQLPFLCLRFFLNCDMGDQPGSAHFQTLFDSALQAYEKNTGVSLAEHPLAAQLQDCHNVESITTLLQHRAKDFSDFRGKNRTMKLIESTVSILSILSANSALGGSIGVVCQNSLIGYSTSDNLFQAFPPATAIQAGLAILLAVCAFRYSHVHVLLTAY